MAIDKELFYASHGLKYPVVTVPDTVDTVVKDKFFTKADMVAMLEELQLEINKAESHRYDDQIDRAFNKGLHKGGQLIQLKINALKAESES